ncbi:hypothetical protein LQZ24_00385 [Fructobacillus sp. M1-13]|uniref:Major facilitator superfamily (MFS) profile domain-containing protein n=1 Tax=Fructobacillus papyriferae TaxID=2713171 RepID=A0ABS5QNC2_9LACO|nr:hypothetical protein [Fructobacillus papyriferae]MBS9334496.1 hypothetical protein [Fructobacillus papyriferae]MCD2158485.1 hypothetical protein [Fructobacillus papyriferae]
MVWYFWAGLWLVVLLLIMIWRFLYRMLPGLSFIDLTTLPNWLFFYLIEGTAFYRSDLLFFVALSFLIGAIVAFLILGRKNLGIARFSHYFWRAMGLLGAFLSLITILLALVSQFLS